MTSRKEIDVKLDRVTRRNIDAAVLTSDEETIERAHKRADELRTFVQSASIKDAELVLGNTSLSATMQMASPDTTLGREKRESSARGGQVRKEIYEERDAELRRRAEEYYEEHPDIKTKKLSVRVEIAAKYIRAEAIKEHKREQDRGEDADPWEMERLNRFCLSVKRIKKLIKEK